MSVTHIAGVDLEVCGRTIQRCSLCGEKLVDSLGMVMPLNPDGTTPKIGTWPVGRQVRVIHGYPTHWELLDDNDGKLAEDSCLELVEN